MRAFSRKLGDGIFYLIILNINVFILVFHAITNQRTISAYVLRPNLTLKIDSESQMLFLLSNCY